MVPGFGLRHHHRDSRLLVVLLPTLLSRSSRLLLLLRNAVSVGARMATAATERTRQTSMDNSWFNGTCTHTQRERERERERQRWSPLGLLYGSVFGGSLFCLFVGIRITNAIGAGLRRVVVAHWFSSCRCCYWCCCGSSFSSRCTMTTNLQQ